MPRQQTLAQHLEKEMRKSGMTVVRAGDIVWELKSGAWLLCEDRPELRYAGAKTVRIFFHPRGFMFEGYGVARDRIALIHVMTLIRGERSEKPLSFEEN
jgi:hypothetical protein